MTTLFIHIGLPSTGSTSCQASWAAAADQLRSAGLLYPETLRDAHGAHHGLVANGPDRPIAGLEKLVREAAASSCHSVLISSEDFYSVEPEAFLELFRRDFDPIVAIAVVRPPMNWASSVWAKRVELGQVSVRFDEWLQTGFLTSSGVDGLPPFARVDQRLQGWSRVLSSEHMMVFNYCQNSEEFLGDVILRRACRDVNIQLPRFRVNAALPLPTLMLALRLLNKFYVLSGDVPQERRTAIARRLVLGLSGVPPLFVLPGVPPHQYIPHDEPPPQLLSADQAAERIRAYFGPVLEQISAEFGLTVPLGENRNYFAQILGSLESTPLSDYLEDAVLRQHLPFTPLPADFDARRYVELNPDLPQGRVEATAHFMRWGAAEQRNYK